jgi:hypothetical protein
MDATEQAALLAAAQEEMEAIDARGGMQAGMTAMSLMGICAALQLALRHPGFAQKPTAKLVRQWIVEIKEQMGAAGYINVARLIEMGFHKQFDTGENDSLAG